MENQTSYPRGRVAGLFISAALLVGLLIAMNLQVQMMVLLKEVRLFLILVL